MNEDEKCTTTNIFFASSFVVVVVGGEFTIHYSVTNSLLVVSNFLTLIAWFSVDRSLCVFVRVNGSRTFCVHVQMCMCEWYCRWKRWWRRMDVEAVVRIRDSIRHFSQIVFHFFRCDSLTCCQTVKCASADAQQHAHSFCSIFNFSPANQHRLIWFFACIYN